MKSIILALAAVVLAISFAVPAEATIFGRRNVTRVRIVNNGHHHHRSNNFSRSRSFDTFNRLNAFGSRTVVDRHGNVFQVDGLGRVTFLGNIHH